MSIEVPLNQGLKRSFLIIIALVLAAFIWIGTNIALNGKLTLFAGVRPTNLGITSGELAPCPSTPNCVSSFSKDALHRIEPITYNSTSEEAIKNLRKVIQSFDRSEIISQTDNYIYAEFTSSLMGFVDDVEFYLDAPLHKIQVRSASRLGESDLGVNRQRISQISIKLHTLGDF